jgi:hypothetical protein
MQYAAVISMVYTEHDAPYYYSDTHYLLLEETRTLPSIHDPIGPMWVFGGQGGQGLAHTKPTPAQNRLAYQPNTGQPTPAQYGLAYTNPTQSSLHQPNIQ